MTKLVTVCVRMLRKFRGKWTVVTDFPEISTHLLATRTVKRRLTRMNRTTNRQETTRTILRKNLRIQNHRTNLPAESSNDHEFAWSSIMTAPREPRRNNEFLEIRALSEPTSESESDSNLAPTPPP